MGVTTDTSKGKTTGRRFSLGSVGNILTGTGTLLVVVAVLAVGGLQGQKPATSSSAHTEQTGSDRNGAHLVQVLAPRRHDVTQVLSLAANISPWHQATLYARVAGYVKQVHHDKGDRVEKGELLAVIDAPEIEKQYRQAAAEYEIKQVTYERLASVWTANPDVIAKQDVDVALAEAQKAKHFRDSQRAYLDYTKIYAPFSGIITARFVDPGALVQAATGSATQSTPLFTVMDTSRVRIYANVPQEAASLARPGVPVKVTAKERPGMDLAGTITRTTQALDPSSRTLLVEVDLPNPDDRLQPGMFANVTFFLETHPQALVIPPAAVALEKSGHRTFVFVVEQGKARRVPVTTGIDDGTWVEIVDGLAGTEQIVVVGKGLLRDGQEVQAFPYNLPAGQHASQKL